MSTRAIKYLTKKKIPFEVITYQHAEKGAEFAARAVGFPLARTIKTLVVDLGRKQYRLILMPGDAQVSLKKLAKACGVKRAMMADTRTAERLTGYLVGGISPFGTRQRLEAVMDEALLVHPQVLINGGQRGTLLKMAPTDIADLLAAEVADIDQAD